MHERLALIKTTPRHVLDAGCGEGADLVMLQQAYGDAKVIGVDASFSMLNLARQRQRNASTSMTRLLAGLLPSRLASRNGTPSLIGANFAELPLAPNSVDLVWSNLALHWHPQPDRVFAEWRRVLRTDGLLMFSCFGPDTFREVRDAFRHADDGMHVLNFVDMHDFGDMLVNTGFSTPVMDMELITVTYDTVDKVLRDVRAWGGNPLDGRHRGLAGKNKWRRLLDTLEAGRRPDKKLALSFEIIYGHAFRPVPRKTATGEAIVQFQPSKR